MFSTENIEEKINTNEKKIRELDIRHEKLDMDISNFLEELDVTPEQLSAFISNPENFTEENWKELQRRKKQLDEKLNVELKSIRDPLKSKKAFASLKINPQWLYVK